MWKKLWTVATLFRLETLTLPTELVVQVIPIIESRYGRYSELNVLCFVCCVLCVVCCVLCFVCCVLCVVCCVLCVCVCVREREGERERETRRERKTLGLSHSVEPEFWLGVKFKTYFF
jgi:hypothetical protein